jgi:hypothetical protein
MADVRNYIGFSQNENLIKEYDGLRMFSPVRGKVGIAVTSKRLIVYSSVRNFFEAKTESLYQQVAIGEIKGAGAVNTFRPRPVLIVPGVILVIVGILLAVMGISGTKMLLYAGIGCAILGIVLAIVGALWKKRLLRIEIWGNAWSVSLGEFETIRADLSPGPDLLKAVEELGALIIEIQEGTL